MTESESPTLEARRAQTFPTLGANEIARLHRFGKPRRFTDGAHVLETGKVSPGIYVVLKGAIRVTGRDGHGHEPPVTEHGPGNFSGELSQLSRRPSFVDGIALGETDTLEIDAEHLHALLIAEATLGEKMMRAMILRRVALIESGAGDPVLIGAASSSAARSHGRHSAAVDHVLTAIDRSRSFGNQESNQFRDFVGSARSADRYSAERSHEILTGRVLIRAGFLGEPHD